MDVITIAVQGLGCTCTTQKSVTCFWYSFASPEAEAAADFPGGGGVTRGEKMYMLHSQTRQQEMLSHF